MIKEILQSIQGIEFYPMISLLLFFASFALVIIAVFRMRPSEVEYASRLPLDEADRAASDDSSDRIGE
jgi:hypothetical protein